MVRWCGVARGWMVGRWGVVGVGWGGGGVWVCAGGANPTCSPCDTKNVEQQCPARRDGDLTSLITCTRAPRLPPPPLVRVPMMRPAAPLSSGTRTPRVRLGKRGANEGQRRSGREWGGGGWGTHHCTLVFLPLQETHYSSTPPGGRTAGPATDVRALPSITLGALAPRRCERGTSFWRAHVAKPPQP